MQIIIIGSSGSGKSTLAKKITNEFGCAHLDLDILAWKDLVPPERESLDVSMKRIKTFIDGQLNWVIEGGYSDLIEPVLDKDMILVYLNPGLDICLENCRNRPWEPHKYASIEEQNKNLGMLLDWVADYWQRQDTFSKLAHDKLFSNFSGSKVEIPSNFESSQVALYIKDLNKR